MKTFSAALLLILTAAAVTASADTFNVNITYSDGGVGTGQFTSSSPYTTINTWTFTVSGGTLGNNFTSSSPGGFQTFVAPPAPGACAPADVQELTFADFGIPAFAPICLSTALSAAGATLDLANTLDCGAAACGTATAGSITPAPANVAPTFTKSFGASTLVVGQTTTLTFTITNPAGNSGLTGLFFQDVLPAGLEVTPGPHSNSCGGTFGALPNFIQLFNGSISAGLSTCTNTVTVGAVGPVSLATTLTNTTLTGVQSNEAPTSGTASASILVIPADAQLISYAANLGAGQSVIDVTNAGTVDPPVALPDYICANVYTFAEDQQLISCCTCNLSPNDLQTLSVQNDLINNTLTPGVPIGVTVALVATDNGNGSGACNAATVTDTKLAAGMRAWGTHLHAAPGGAFALTETPFSQVALSEAELKKMTSYCGFIKANGSNFGICNSCKQGAAGSTKK